MSRYSLVDSHIYLGLYFWVAWRVFDSTRTSTQQPPGQIKDCGLGGEEGGGVQGASKSSYIVVVRVRACVLGGARYYGIITTLLCFSFVCSYKPRDRRTAAVN